MDEILETRLRQLAEENDLDPDQFLALAESQTLPDGLGTVAEAILGDVAVFARALDKLKKQP